MSQHTDVSLLLKRARLLLEEGQATEALSTLEAIRPEDEHEQEELNYLLGWGNLQSRNWSEAARLLAPFTLFEEHGREVESLNNREIQALCLLKMGNMAIQNLRFEEASRHLLKALKSLHDRRVQLPNAQIKAHYYIAGAYKMRGLFNAAIQDYLLAQEYAIVAEDNQELPCIYDGLTEAYRVSGKFMEALDSGKKALELYRRAGNRKGECVILNRLGRIALKLGDYVKAGEYYTESISVAATIPDHRGDKMIMTNCAALADLRLDEGRVEDARRYCDNAAQISARSSDKFLAGLADMITGKVIYAEAKQVEGEQRCQLMEQAIHWFEQASKALAEGQAYDLAEVYGRWAEALEDIGQGQEALVRWKSAYEAMGAAKGPSWQEI
jgi:tetratricopeptide (TPR) repeat protein